jgi:hypothetical protein
MRVVRFGFQDMFSAGQYTYAEIHYFDFHGMKREVVELCDEILCATRPRR